MAMTGLQEYVIGIHKIYDFSSKERRNIEKCKLLYYYTVIMIVFIMRSLARCE